MLEKQRMNHVSLITQFRSVGTTQCEKIFCHDNIQIYLFDKTKQRLSSEISSKFKTTETKNFKVNYRSVFRGLKSQRQEVHAGVRYNSVQHCTQRVHAGQTSPVHPLNLLENAAATQMPAA